MPRSASVLVVWISRLARVDMGDNGEVPDIFDWLGGHAGESAGEGAEG